MNRKRAEIGKSIRTGILALAVLVVPAVAAHAQYPLYGGIGYGYRGYNAPNVYSGAGIGYGYQGYNAPNVYSGVGSAPGYPLTGVTTYSSGYSGVVGGGSALYGGYPGVYGGGVGVLPYSGYSYTSSVGGIYGAPLIYGRRSVLGGIGVGGFGPFYGRQFGFGARPGFLW